MLKCRQAVHDVANEFVIEFYESKDAEQVAQGKEFEHEGATYRVIKSIPGIQAKDAYSYLVIVDIIKQSKDQPEQ